MILYKTNIWNKEIKEVEVTKITEKSIWLKGDTSRHARKTDYAAYWDTYEQAKKHLIRLCDIRVRTAERKLQKAISDMEELKKL